MPNDIPDYTGQQLVGLVGGVSGQFLGDIGAPSLAADSATESIVSGGGLNSIRAVLASFKAAAGQVIALVGAKGAFTQGSNTAVTPPFGQATTAGNLLIACVQGGIGEPTTAAAGWVKAVDLNLSNLWTGIWCKPNCGAAEAAPQFTSAGGNTPMFGQVFEVSGAAVALPVDQVASVSNTIGAASITVAAPAADAAFGDLVVFAAGWVTIAQAPATFGQAMGNRATPVHLGDSGASSLNIHASFTFGIVPAATLAHPLGVAVWPVDGGGFSAPGGGVAPSVVLAAVAGRTWILNSFEAVLLSNGNADVGEALQLLDGATIIRNWRMAVPAPAGSTHTITQTGLAIPGTLGSSMTMKLLGIGATAFASIDCSAYLK